MLGSYPIHIGLFFCLLLHFPSGPFPKRDSQIVGDNTPINDLRIYLLCMHAFLALVCFLNTQVTWLGDVILTTLCFFSLLIYQITIGLVAIKIWVQPAWENIETKEQKVVTQFLITEVSLFVLVVAANIMFLLFRSCRKNQQTHKMQG